MFLQQTNNTKSFSVQTSQIGGEITYKNNDESFKFAYGVYLDQNQRLGLKFKLRLFNIKLTIPVSLASSSTYSMVPKKVAAVLLLISSCVMYCCSEACPEDEEQSKLLAESRISEETKYRDSCSRYNAENQAVLNERSLLNELTHSGLVILCGVMHDSSLTSDVAAHLNKLKLQASQETQWTIEKVKGYRALADTFGCNVTNELNSRVFLSNLDFDVDAFASESSQTVPVIKEQSGRLTTSTIYLLKNRICYQAFTKNVRIQYH